MPNKKIRIAIFIPFELDQKNHSGAARLEMFDYLKNIQKDIYYFGKRKIGKNIFWMGKYYKELNFGYFLNLIRALCLLRKKRKYQLIWSTSPPAMAAFVATFCKKIFRLPLVLDLRDPLISGVVIERGEKSWQAKLAKKIEKFVLKNANVICVATPQLGSFLRRTYQIKKDKIRVISNATKIKKTKIEQLGRKKTVFYAGIFAPYQVIDRVIKNIAQNKNQNSGWQFHFYGYQPEKYPQLNQTIKKYQIENIVKLNPPISRKEVFKKLAQSDIALVPISGLKFQKYLNYAIPLKFYEAVAFNKPILLYGGTTASKNLLQKHQLGIICKNNQNIFAKLNYLTKNYLNFQKNLSKVSFLRKTEAKKLGKIINRAQKPKIAILRANSYQSESRLIKTHQAIKNLGTCTLVLWNRQGETENYPFTRSLKLKAPFGSSILLLYLPLWFVFCLYQLIKIKPKIIHAADLECIIPAVIYKLFSRTKIIYDIYDVSADKLNLKGKMRDFALAVERFYIRRSNLLIVPDEERIEQLKLKNFSQIEVIYNSELIDDSPKKTLNFKNRRTITIAYVGVLSKGIRGLEFILEVAKKFKDKINFVIAGYGPDEKKFQKAFANYSEKNIKFLGRVSHQKARQINKTTDIIISLLDPDFRNYQFATSTKVFEAFALTKPVISSKNTATGKTVKKTNWGIVTPYSEKDLKYALEKIATGQVSFNLEPNRVKKYSWRKMAQKLTKIYQELLNTN